jgi:hypothetical protein
MQVIPDFRLAVPMLLYRLDNSLIANRFSIPSRLEQFGQQRPSQVALPFGDLPGLLFLSDERQKTFRITFDPQEALPFEVTPQRAPSDLTPDKFPVPPLR